MKNALKFLAVGVICTLLTACLPDGDLGDAAEQKASLREAQASGMARSLSVVASQGFSQFVNNPASPFAIAVAPGGGGLASVPTQLIDFQAVFGMNLGPASQMVRAGYCGDAAADANQSLLVWLNGRDATGQFTPIGLGEGGTGAVMAELMKMNNPASVGTARGGTVTTNDGQDMTLGNCAAAFDIPLGAPVMVFANLQEVQTMTNTTTRVETQTQSCPEGQSGTITQRRTVTVEADGTTDDPAWDTVSSLCFDTAQEIASRDITTSTSNLLNNLSSSLQNEDLGQSLASLNNQACKSVVVKRVEKDPQTGEHRTVNYNTCSGQTSVAAVSDMQSVFLRALPDETRVGACSASTVGLDENRPVSVDGIPVSLDGRFTATIWGPNDGATYLRHVNLYRVTMPDGTSQEVTLRDGWQGVSLNCSRTETVSFGLGDFTPDWATVDDDDNPGNGIGAGVNPANLTLLDEGGIVYERTANVTGWADSVALTPNSPSYSRWTPIELSTIWQEQKQEAMTCPGGLPGTRTSMRRLTLSGYKTVSATPWVVTTDCAACSDTGPDPTMTTTGASVTRMWAGRGEGFRCPAGWVDTELTDDGSIYDRHSISEDEEHDNNHLCLRSEVSGVTVTTRWMDNWQPCPSDMVDTGLRDADLRDGHNFDEEDSYGGNRMRWCLGVNSATPGARMEVVRTSNATNLDELYDQIQNQAVGEFGIAEYNFRTAAAQADLARFAERLGYTDIVYDRSNCTATRPTRSGPVCTQWAKATETTAASNKFVTLQDLANKGGWSYQNTRFGPRIKIGPYCGNSWTPLFNGPADLNDWNLNTEDNGDGALICVRIVGGTVDGGAVCPIDGVCPTSLDPSYNAPTPTCVAGDATAISGTGPWSWTCNGKNGSTVSPTCTVQRRQDGACGNTSPSYSIPSGDCAVGTASPVNGVGPWTWTCGGVNGGNASGTCTVIKKVDGACGGAHSATPVATAPNASLCNDGAMPTVTLNGTNYEWSCPGTNGGNPASCSVPKLAAVNECGDQICAGPVSSAPTSNLCADGSTPAVTDTGTAYQWTCSGQSGAPAVCSVAKAAVQNGSCGTANSGTPVASAPTSNLCGNGTVRWDDQTASDGAFDWTCLGNNNGSSADDIACSVPKAVSYTYHWETGNWSSWSACSGGQQERTRPVWCYRTEDSVNMDPIDPSQTNCYNAATNNPKPEWRETQACSMPAYPCVVEADVGQIVDECGTETFAPDRATAIVKTNATTQQYWLHGASSFRPGLTCNGRAVVSSSSAAINALPTCDPAPSSCMYYASTDNGVTWSNGTSVASCPNGSSGIAVGPVGNINWQCVCDGSGFQCGSGYTKVGNSCVANSACAADDGSPYISGDEVPALSNGQTYDYTYTDDTMANMIYWETYEMRATCTNGTLSKQVLAVYSFDPMNCFVGETLITMADGSKKAVSELQVGDMVRGQTRDNKVLAVPAFDTKKAIYSINGSKAFVTAGHPFMTQDGWKAIDPSETPEESHKVLVGKLEIGDTLYTDEKSSVRVNSIERDEKGGINHVYNPMLDGDHTYYANGLLVHNK